MRDNLQFLGVMLSAVGVMLLTGLGIGLLFAAMLAPFVLLIKWIF